MRTIEITVSQNETAPNQISVGYNGEHKATDLLFKLSDAIAAGIDYFRVVMTQNRSKKLYAATDKTVSYSLPQCVLENPMLLIQLEGYKFQSDEPTLVFKSGVITAKVERSLGYDPELPDALISAVDETEAELEQLLTKCSTLKEELTPIETAIASKLDNSRKIAGIDLVDDITAAELSAALSLGNKADKATTLGGYGITDAYTKENANSTFVNKSTKIGGVTVGSGIAADRLKKALGIGYFNLGLFETHSEQLVGGLGRGYVTAELDFSIVKDKHYYARIDNAAENNTTYFIPYCEHYDESGNYSPITAGSPQMTYNADEQCLECEFTASNTIDSGLKLGIFASDYETPTGKVLLYEVIEDAVSEGLSHKIEGLGIADEYVTDKISQGKLRELLGINDICNYDKSIYDAKHNVTHGDNNVYGFISGYVFNTPAISFEKGKRYHLSLKNTGNLKSIDATTIFIYPPDAASTGTGGVVLGKYARFDSSINGYSLDFAAANDVSGKELQIGIVCSEDKATNKSWQVEIKTSEKTYAEITAEKALANAKAYVDEKLGVIENGAY